MKKSVVDKVSTKTKKHVKELVALIEYHRNQYHTKDAPEISDEAYDSLVRELSKLISTYSEFSKYKKVLEFVGGDADNAFSKVRHRVRQWSFDNVFSDEALREWETRLYRFLEKKGIYGIKLEYIAEHKIDGLKAILEYKEGALVRATTRGDGVVGEDITHTVRTIGDVPKQLTEKVDSIAVGEVWLPEDEFLRINKERKKNNEPLFANPRNAAAGSLRQLDSAVTAGRKLATSMYDIDFFDAKNTDIVAPTTQREELQLLKKLGFHTNTYYTHCKTIDDVINFYKKWAPKKNKMAYGMDGVVIKVNDITLQKALGHTAKSPRYGIAYKFPAEQATSVIEDIQLQVGRTGVLTPVAHLRPVLIAGSTVSRATLHNEDQIKRLDIRVGDTVILQKAGDVIPEILKVLKELRPEKTKAYTFPRKIAECGGDGGIERIAGKSAYRCVAKDSDTLHRQRLYYFASKEALNIDGVGPRIIDLLLDNNLINTYADFFTLTVGDLKGLPSFKEKAAQNVVDAITTAKTVSLNRLLVALSIDHVGAETARLIANHFASLDAIRKADEEELAAIHGVGDIVAHSLYEWLHTATHINVLNALLEHIKIEQQSKAIVGGVFVGKTFVFTGSLPTLSRSKAQDLVRQNGGHVSNTVSKNTDYVVLGKDAGSKGKKAQVLGVKILSEEAFFALIKSKKK